MFERHVFDASVVEYKSDRCTLRIAGVRPGAVLVKIEGMDVGVFGDAPLKDLAARVGSQTGVELFIDAREAQGPSMEVSHQWAEWLKAHRGQFAQVNMLVGSKYLQVTAQFVRSFAAMGEAMKVSTDAAAFDAALVRA